jgi:hypothetical protein
MANRKNRLQLGSRECVLHAWIADMKLPASGSFTRASGAVETACLHRQFHYSWFEWSEKVAVLRERYCEERTYDPQHHVMPHKNEITDLLIPQGGNLIYSDRTGNNR